ncbi:MAG: HAMP domain-containing sensor histidine kinase [Pseudomonadota bacterium]
MIFSVQQLYRNSVALLCAVFICVLTLTLTCVSFFELRANQARALTIQARMVALDLGDVEGIDNSSSNAALEAVAANKDLILACVYDRNNVARGFSQGQKDGEQTSLQRSCNQLANDAREFQKIVVTVPIIKRRLPEPTGAVTLVASTPSIIDYAVVWLMISVLLGLCLAFFCWLLGLRLQRALIKPIRQISSTAQRVSLYKDYALRVVPGVLNTVPKEIQALTDSFNAMLKEIEDRDSRLSRKSSELEKSRQTAEAASQAKSQFLANVSHELRTPLNAIIGFSAMIGEQQFGSLGHPKYVEYARDIQDSGRHLLDVINDILDLTKAETGKLSVTFSSLNIAKVIEKALRIVAGQAHQRKIDIYTDLPEKMPKIIGDPVRLVQILLNLLSNAIKFTDEGGKVTVSARAEAGRQGIYYFTLTVKDSGIGMSDADIRKAFSTFNQADSGLNRKYEGAGLGLPLTKRLVDLHHGKIKIESTPGDGTLVTVRLTSDPALLD